MTLPPRASGTSDVVTVPLPDVATLGKWGGIATALAAGVGVMVRIGRQTQVWNQTAMDLTSHKADVAKRLDELREERRASDDERRSQYEDLRERMDHMIAAVALLGKESARSEARLDAIERHGGHT